MVPIHPFSGPFAYGISSTNTATPPRPPSYARFYLPMGLAWCNSGTFVLDLQYHAHHHSSLLPADFNVLNFSQRKNQQQHHDLSLYQRLRHTVVHSSHSAACARSNSHGNRLCPCAIECDRLGSTTVVFSCTIHFDGRKIFFSQWPAKSCLGFVLLLRTRNTHVPAIHSCMHQGCISTPARVRAAPALLHDEHVSETGSCACGKLANSVRNPVPLRGMLGLEPRHRTNCQRPLVVNTSSNLIARNDELELPQTFA
jgi:hypothetical protein